MKLTYQKLFKLAAASLALAGLAACGGGSGDSPSVAPPPTALQIATTYLASLDSSIATSLVSTGAAVTSTYDGCYLNGGRTKANAISNYDADWAVNPSSSAYRIGSTRVNPVVTADRNTTNPDGTARREIDVQYAINYKDGSVDNAANLTLITGSSSGSCATAQNSPDVRLFGDRQMVSVDIRAETTRTDQFELRSRLRLLAPGQTTPFSTTTIPGFTQTYANVPAGQPQVVPVFYSRQVSFRIQDPMGNATYAVVTGPGFLTVSNVLTPWSIKMLSPRLLKSDPLLAGKLGNYTSLTEDSVFPLCRLPNGSSPGSAALADCATGGASSSQWGVSMNLPDSTTGNSTTLAAASDDRLSQVGITTGTYTFKIYNDDGWKTVNGQAGKTPIATYTAQLDSLPISFVDMNVTGNVNNDKFPKISSSSSTAAVAASELSGQAYVGALSWTAPLFVATNAFKLSFVEAYAEGALSTTGLPAFPRVAKFTDIYPASNALSGTINVTADPVTLALKNYSEVQVNYTNRNGSRIRSLISFN